MPPEDACPPGKGSSAAAPGKGKGGKKGQKARKGKGTPGGISAQKFPYGGKKGGGKDNGHDHLPCMRTPGTLGSRLPKSGRRRR